MQMAVTRAVSSSLANCALSFIPRHPIDMAKARAQHHAYEEALRGLGCEVISLPEQPEMPDSMFVEDPALVLEELAIIFPLGTEARRKEAPSLAEELAKYRKLEHVKLPGTVEGGDVLRLSKKLYVGLTKRSNPEGIRQLAVIVGKYGYEVTVVPVTGCLHLKSAVTSVGRNLLLANREWFDWKRIEGQEWIDVDPAEPHAANALAVGGSVLFPESFPKTSERLRAKSVPIRTLDISELQKAESGLTCSSQIFEFSR